MKMGDFLSLIAALFTVGLTLVAIYSILGRIGWISKKGLVGDAFVLWITWLLAAITALIPLSILDIEVRFLGRGSLFLTIPAVIAYVVSSISVYFAMRTLSNPPVEDFAGYVSSDDRVQSNVSLRNALLISAGAALALAAGIAATVLMNTGYTYLFPPADNPFRIYG